MNARQLFILTFVFVSMLTLIVSCSQQKTEWLGTIDVVDGITVVRNPIVPLYGEEVFEMEEELSIGEAEGREEYMFSQIACAIDGEENIYVLDYRDAHIRVFDKFGKYLRTIGKKGEGPGEMQRPRSIQVTPFNEIMIYDLGNRRFCFYTLEGDYIKQEGAATVGAILNAHMDSQGNIIGEMHQINGYSLNKFNIKLGLIKEFYRKDFQEGTLRIMSPTFHFDIDSNDNIICGFSDKYEFQIFNSDGQLLKKIVKEFKPRAITEKEKKERINVLTGGRGFPPEYKVVFPKHHVCFTSISVDEKGWIYMGSSENEPDGSGYYFDVFDEKGKYIAKVPIEVINERYPLIWKREKLYLIKEDEAGYQYVKRYKVTWSFH